ncbi:MAG TPA: TetR/AcrR family transcriptional regulator [Aggregatilineaceae bacterium]|nr:TetR/AcrR family transcriptional regulator [Aggregatilineaceae bacterium]
MPRGRYQQKQWEDRQAAILDVLERLSMERGFAAVTMDDVANEVGISKATLYQHFDSKDAMLIELLGQHEDNFIEWLKETAEQPPLERLRKTMLYLMEGHVSPLRGLVSLGPDDVLPVFYSSDDLVARHKEIIDSLTAIIEAGQAQGQIALDLAPHAVIGAMMALSNVSMGSRSFIPQYHHAEQMVLMFERAIRPVGKEDV